MTSSPRRAALGTISAVATAVAVVAGAWAAGGVLTDDALTAKALTGGWFVVTGLVAAGLARSRRVPAVAVLTAWLVTTGVTGGFLLVTSTVDRVVHERVVTAPTGTDPTTVGRSAPVATLEASGRFRDGAHDTRGTASLVRTPDGRRVLTLPGFATAPGPDLRVYAVPGRAGVDGAVDLGRLKGNKGDQQYVVPRAVSVGSVVVWCRAFSVDFGTAVLRGPA